MTVNSIIDTPTSAYGHPQGAFQVDASGQACYHLPIQVPPGAGGLQPQLEIAYHHRQGNGLLGVGWSIVGLSAISRIPASDTVDGFKGAINYDANDRLALDGQRLINIEGKYGQPGTVYYTEIHHWKQVRAGAANQGFVVTMKNGEIWRYGNTADSRILALGSKQVRVWALSSIEDLNGNRIEYQYTDKPLAGAAESGAYYIQRISYTVRDDLSANRHVVFCYEERPDPLVQFVGGHACTTGYRLRQISTWLGDCTQIRRYVLAYHTGSATQLSRLSGITEIGAAAADSADAHAPAMPEIRICWQDNATPGFDLGPGSVLEQHVRTVSVLSMDITGNGRSDLAQLWLDQDHMLNVISYLVSDSASGPIFTKCRNTVLGSFPADCQIFPADLNGNGRADLLLAYRDTVSGHLMLAAFLSNGSGFEPAGIHDTGDAWSADHLGFFAMDVDGDGRTDFVEAYGHDDPKLGAMLYFRSYLSRFGESDANGTSTSPGINAGFGPGLISPTADPARPGTPLALWPMDVNGDGMVDIVRVWQDGPQGDIYATAYLSIALARDQVFFLGSKDSHLGSRAGTAPLAFLPADINGDGMMDLVQVWQESTPGTGILHLTSFISDGSGGYTFGTDSVFSAERFGAGPFTPHHCYPMGFSGGAQTQLLRTWVSGEGKLIFSIYAGSPAGQFRLVGDIDAGPLGSATLNDLLLVADVDGDGKADLIRVTTDQNQQPLAVPYLSSGVYPDLVSSITDQLGARTEIHYATLSDDSVYSVSGQPVFPRSPGLRYPYALSPAQFPVQAVLGQAFHVVSGYTQSHDAERNRFPLALEFAYTYRDAQYDMRGRGCLGFADMAELNLKTGLRTRRLLNQTFPLHGTLAALTLEADARYSDDPRLESGNPAVLMKRTTYTYQCCARASGATPDVPPQPVFEVLLSTTQSSYFDYGSTRFDYATASRYSYDEYGNLICDAYLSYVDPINGQPLDPNQAVYRYHSYRNDVSATGWALGYRVFSKISGNAVDHAIDTFMPGDFKLEHRSYTADGYQLASHAHWDNTHHRFLTTRYSYDPFGNRTSVTLPSGAVTSYTYEEQYHCHLQQTTFPRNADGVSMTTWHGSDPRYGIEIAFQNENGAIFITALDAFGRPQQQQGPRPLASMASDPNALSTGVTGDAPLRQRFLAATVCTLATTQYHADGAGGIACTEAALQSFPTDTGRDFLAQTRYCDPLGRDVLVAQAHGHRAGDVMLATRYGAHGLPISKSLPYFATAATAATATSAATTATTATTATQAADIYRYDVLGRILSQQQAAGPDGLSFRTRAWAYGTDGMVTLTQAAGTGVASTQLYQHRLFDGKSKVVTATAVGDDYACTVFQYDALARLVGSTDPATPAHPRGVRTEIVYDSLDRKISIDNPDQNTTGNPNIKALSYAYDPISGRLAHQIDAAQHAIDYSYDQLDRVISMVCTDGRSITYRYDARRPNGMRRLATVTVKTQGAEVESVREYAYDCYGNANGCKLAIDNGVLTYISRTVYDPQRRVVQHVYPNDTTLTRVYQSGVLTRQSLGEAQLVYPLERYTAAGRFGQILAGSKGQIDTRYQLSPASEVYRETVETRAGVALQWAYQYNALNQLLSVDDSSASDAGTQRFSYRHHRLSSVRLPGCDETHFDYDAAGNLLSKKMPQRHDRCQYQYQYRGHLTTCATVDDETVYSATADACGRVIARSVAGQLTRLNYDDQGHLRTVAGADGTVIRDIYTDHLGRRVRQRSPDCYTAYIDDAYQVAYTGSLATVTTYLRDGLGIAAAVSRCDGHTSVRYFRRDLKGNITHVFDGDGALHTTLSYDSYGVPSADTELVASQPTYRQQTWDRELGLYHFGGRYYDPMLGRFLTPQTHLDDKQLLQSDAWNRYAFERNNPFG